MQSTRTCTIDGCDKPHKAFGLCNLHYQRARRGGPLQPIRRTEMDRFLPKVDKDGPIPAKAPHLGPCWIWTASRYRNGYPQFRIGRSMGYAHRWVYEYYHGALDKDMCVDHMCWTRHCVNPAHLRAVTTKQNLENQSGLSSANTSGFRGVSFDSSRNLWRAVVTHNRKTYPLGRFKTAEEAAIAARDARLRLFTCNDLDKLDLP